VEVCIVPVLSHNRWGGNEFKDIVEEGSPVLKQRAHIQGNDPYVFCLVSLCHTGTQRVFHSTITVICHTPFVSADENHAVESIFMHL